jgi:hypothetical protein
MVYGLKKGFVPQPGLPPIPRDFLSLGNAA